MRLIDADELKEEFAVPSYEAFNVSYIMEVIDKQPTIDADPPRRGKWILKIRHCYADECICSVCGQLMTTHPNERMSYCPNCGAEMGDEVWRKNMN